MDTSQVVFRRFRGDRGASLAEYGLIITVIAIICIVTISVLGRNTEGPFDDASEGFPSSQTSEPPMVTPPGGPGPGGPTTTTLCSTTSTLPEEVGPDCTTTTTADP